MKLVIPVLALALVAADAFRVDVSDVAPPVDILGEHQELERTFKVYSDDALEKISVGIAGPVFIAYKDAAVETPAPTTPEPTTETPTVTPEVTTPEVTTPEPTFTPDVNATQDGSLDTSSSSGSGSSSSSDDTIVFPDGAVDLHAASHKEKLVATVTVSGNSSAMLELIEIVPHKKDKTDGLRLTYKNTDATVEGYVLTQIEVANKHDVRHVTSELASVVDVATNVLSQDTKKAIKIRSVGASNVFVSDQGEVKADHVELTVAGSGSIQVVAGSLKLDGTLSTTLTGSGALALHADSVQASKLDTSVSGSGALFVVTKSLAAKDFSGSVYGSAFASVSASDAGHVESEDFTVAGSGAMYAGSIVANKSSVDVWGSGQAYVQVTDKLKTSASYSGQVYYVGAKPAVVKTSGWWFWRSQVKAAESDKTMPHEIVSSPRVYPEYIALELRENHHDKEPRIKVVDEATTTTALLTTHLAAVAHGPHGVWIFAGVATGLVAMAMLAQSYQQHRVRRHYTPLV